MSECRICDASPEGASKFDCTYCDETFCPDHRLPEKHDCPVLKVEASETWFYNENGESETRARRWQHHDRSDPPPKPDCGGDEHSDRRRDHPERRSTETKRIDDPREPEQIDDPREPTFDASGPDVNADGSLDTGDIGSVAEGHDDGDASDWDRRSMKRRARQLAVNIVYATFVLSAAVLAAFLLSWLFDLGLFSWL